jgi:ribosomal protein S18 acetylase RimI-like enzyme
MTTSAAEWSIELLTSAHARDPFDCGDPDLNAHVKKYARQNEVRGIGKTYVALPKGSRTVVGYYTIRFGHVAYDVFPPPAVRRVPEYPVPVMHLGRLAVDLTVQGKGLGETLLLDVCAKSLRASEIAGLFAIEVIAANERARRFYRKYHFEEFLDDSQHLYLAMSQVRDILG